MKKVLLAVSLLLITSLPVYAQDAGLRPSPSPRVKPSAALQVRTAQITDQTKEMVMERVNAQMNKVNEKMTAMWQRLIDRMQTLVEKLQTRINELATAGKDVAAAQTALDEASAALTAAETAVAAQADKEYVIEFTDENGLRVGATTAKTTLRTDLKAVQDLIKEARIQLHEALLAVKEVAGEE